MGVTLNDDEIWDFLSEEKVGILTTLRADGMPVALPMWFVLVDRRVFIQTHANTKKVARIRRDPRASFLVEAGERWAELKAVHLSGRIGIETDEGVVANVAREADRKYAELRTTPERLPDATKRHYAPELVTLRLDHDERIISWDNKKLRLRAPEVR